MFYIVRDTVTIERFYKVETLCEEAALNLAREGRGTEIHSEQIDNTPYEVVCSSDGA